jgi:hypothetical protein
MPFFSLILSLLSYYLLSAFRHMTLSSVRDSSLCVFLLFGYVRTSNVYGIKDYERLWLQSGLSGVRINVSEQTSCARARRCSRVDLIIIASN